MRSILSKIWRTTANYEVYIFAVIVSVTTADDWINNGFDALVAFGLLLSVVYLCLSICDFKARKKRQ